MGPYLMFDASTPPTSAPSLFRAVAGYIGGATPHVWTNEEWARFPSLKKLPIWVSTAAIAGDPFGADKDGAAILDRLHALGVPKRTAVVVDLETRVHPEYVGKLQGIVNRGGYFLWPYGSASTLFGNPAANGYWVADYTGKRFMYSHRGTRATQYAEGTAIDQSQLKQWSYWFRLSRHWKVSGA